MASGIFAVLDDIAMLLDDASVMTKVAAKKTAGILGDDLAVNAEKAIGFKASRELPVIWAITKGSMLNKIVILPFAFVLSSFMPSLIVPILLLGGAYLSYEGAEKVYEWLFHHPKQAIAAVDESERGDRLQKEAAKIKAAIRTDFILSIEIIVIALGTVIEEPLLMQIIVVGFVAMLATVGVYGLVAMLVRMDDVGIALVEKASGSVGTLAMLMRVTGSMLITALPKVIRLLGVIGTIAMLLVGGGMYVHNIDVIHHYLEFMPLIVAELVVGLVVGGIILGLMTIKAQRST